MSHDEDFLSSASLHSPRPSILKSREAAVLLCALLIETARVDGVVKDSETEEIQRLLRQKIAPPTEHPREIYELAEWLASDLNRLELLVENLRDAFAEPEKQAILALLVRVSRADGFVHRLEKKFIEQMLETLDLNGRQLMAAEKASSPID